MPIRLIIPAERIVIEAEVEAAIGGDCASCASRTGRRDASRCSSSTAVAAMLLSATNGGCVPRRGTSADHLAAVAGAHHVRHGPVGLTQRLVVDLLRALPMRATLCRLPCESPPFWAASIRSRSARNACACAGSTCPCLPDTPLERASVRLPALAGIGVDVPLPVGLMLGRRRLPLAARLLMFGVSIVAVVVVGGHSASASAGVAAAPARRREIRSLRMTYTFLTLGGKCAF